jgi:hypothetical protein
MRVPVKFFFALSVGEPQKGFYPFEGQHEHPLAGAAVETELTPIATDVYYHRLFREEPITHRYALLTQAAAEAKPLKIAKARWADLNEIMVEPQRDEAGVAGVDWWQQLDGFMGAIKAHVDDGDVLVVDITPGTRDIPLKLMICLMHLRACYQLLTIRFVTYGQWETGQMMKDVTRNFQLMDWALALARLRQHGDVKPLHKRVVELRDRRLREVASAYRDECYKVLNRLTAKVAGLDLVITYWWHHEITGCLDGITNEVETNLRPFENAVPEYLLLSMALPVLRDCFAVASTSGVTANKHWPLLNSGVFIPRLMRWGRWVEAVALARELIVERAAWWLLPECCPQNIATRHKRIDEALKGRLQAEREALMALPKGAALMDAFNVVQQLRNSVLHAGHASSKGPACVDELREIMDDVVHRLRALALIPEEAAPDMAQGRDRLLFTLGNEKNYRSYAYAMPDGGQSEVTDSVWQATECLAHHRFPSLPKPLPMAAIATRSSRLTGDGAPLRAIQGAAEQAPDFLYIDWDETAGGMSTYTGVLRRMQQAVGAGDRLMLDLTHGLRDMPATVLGMAIFLRYARQVEPALIVYGNEKPAALVDLTPIRDLLSWADATEVFNRGANPAPSARLFNSQSDPLMQELGRDFERLTISLLTFRLGAIREQAQAIAQHIERVKTSPTVWQTAPGLVAVLNLLTETIQPLLQDDGLSNETLLAWFHNRDAFFPYVSLLREQFIRAGGRVTGLGDLHASAATSPTVQRYAELLYKAVLGREKGDVLTPNYDTTKFEGDPIFGPLLNQLDHASLARRLFQAYPRDHWDFLANVEKFRNHLMHAGYNPDTCTQDVKKFESAHKQIRAEAKRAFVRASHKNFAVMS